MERHCSIVNNHMTTVDRENFGVKKTRRIKFRCVYFVNIQAYEIKLTRKFKYTENLAGAHVTQVDVDTCYEW